MSLLNKKILVSGCGFSWSGQERKTWVNVLKSVGAKITDVGGPAVSNQWILNKAFNELRNNNYDCAVIQLTALGKLDVEVNKDRMEELVKPDKLRNFVIDNVWPSSASVDHISKKLYQRWLYSPTLETEDLFCKLLLLKDWCINKGIELTVYQAYEIPWLPEQQLLLGTVVANSDSQLYNQYINSRHYQFHDNAGENTVPCIQYQIELAEEITSKLNLNLLDRIHVIKAKYSKD
jgi:hypothetical protein